MHKSFKKCSIIKFNVDTYINTIRTFIWNTSKARKSVTQIYELHATYLKGEDCESRYSTIQELKDAVCYNLILNYILFRKLYKVAGMQSMQRTRFI